MKLQSVGPVVPFEEEESIDDILGPGSDSATLYTDARSHHSADDDDGDLPLPPLKELDCEAFQVCVTNTEFTVSPLYRLDEGVIDKGKYSVEFVVSRCPRNLRRVFDILTVLSALCLAVRAALTFPGLSISTEKLCFLHDNDILALRNVFFYIEVALAFTLLVAAASLLRGHGISLSTWMAYTRRTLSHFPLFLMSCATVVILSYPVGGNIVEDVMTIGLYPLVLVCVDLLYVFRPPTRLYYVWLGGLGMKLMADWAWTNFRTCDIETQVRDTLLRLVARTLYEAARATFSIGFCYLSAPKLLYGTRSPFTRFDPRVYSLPVPDVFVTRDEALDPSLYARESDVNREAARHALVTNDKGDRSTATEMVLFFSPSGFAAGPVSSEAILRAWVTKPERRDHPNPYHRYASNLRSQQTAPHVFNFIGYPMHRDIVRFVLICLLLFSFSFNTITIFVTLRPDPDNICISRAESHPLPSMGNSITMGSTLLLLAHILYHTVKHTKLPRACAYEYSKLYFKSHAWFLIVSIGRATFGALLMPPEVYQAEWQWVVSTFFFYISGLGTDLYMTIQTHDTPVSLTFLVVGLSFGGRYVWSALPKCGTVVDDVTTLLLTKALEFFDIATLIQVIQLLVKRKGLHGSEYPLIRFDPSKDRVTLPPAHVL